MSSILREKDGRQYHLLPPEGGWGYFITLSISVFFSVTIIPVGVFGMIFGPFLASIGDETYGTTLTNGFFNTVVSSTGLVANQLLQHYSCRKVGLLGAFSFFIGAFLTVFIKTLPHLIITYGLFQGIGFGLIMPAVFTSFNGYFHKRQNVMMGTAQAIIGAIAIPLPIITEKLLTNYGWRGTQLIIAGLALHGFVAAFLLQPAKWHMKKVYLTEIQLEAVPFVNGEKKEIENAMERHLQNILEHRKPSLISIGSNATAISAFKKPTEHKGVFRKIYDAWDLGLFKDPVFVNIAFGVSLSLTADIAFLSLLPMILKNANLSESQTTLTLTVYFLSDLAGRVLLSIVSVIKTYKNRHIFLAGALLSAVFRIGFVMNDSFYWILSTSVILGFLRSLIQIPLPLVIAEEYRERFPTAFTLYMVVCAVISAVFGPLIGFVREVTESVDMVVHLLTFAFLLCAIPWLIEICANRMWPKKLTSISS